MKIWVALAGFVPVEFDVLRFWNSVRFAPALQAPAIFTLCLCEFWAESCGVALVGRLFDAGSFHHWLHSECFGLGFEAFRLGLGLEVLGLEFKVMALGFNVLGQWFGVQGP